MIRRKLVPPKWQLSQDRSRKSAWFCASFSSAPESPKRNKTKKNKKNMLLKPTNWKYGSLILMAQGYVRMTQRGRAVERQPERPQLHAKQHFPYHPLPLSMSLPRAPQQQHGCTQNPHTPPVSGHSCFLTFTAGAGRSRRVRFHQFRVSAWLNNCFIVENVHSVAIQSKLIFPFLVGLAHYYSVRHRSLLSLLFSHRSSLSYVSTHFYNSIKSWKNRRQMSVRRQNATFLTAWMGLFIWTDRHWIQPS